MRELGGPPAQSLVAETVGKPLMEAILPLGSDGSVRKSFAHIIEIAAAIVADRGTLADLSSPAWLDARPASAAQARERLCMMLESFSAIRAARAATPR